MLRVLALLVIACPIPHPMPPPPPGIDTGPRGRITLHASPEAEVRIDGQSVGRTPVIGYYVDPGRHRVELRASCGTRRQTVQVRPGADVAIDIALCGAAMRPDPSGAR